MLFFAYLAVLLSLGSGILAVFTNQRLPLLRLAKKIFHVETQNFASLPQFMNDAQQFRHILQLSVFVLLGTASLFAIIAGLGGLLSKQILTDQIHLGLPWQLYYMGGWKIKSLSSHVLMIWLFSVAIFAQNF